MKSSKSTRQQYGNSERKNGKRSEKSAKLDRKSSRGMIYENEELRLRTININAEVERGQTDIKRLRKENDQLRREIWSLRDEYDRLNKKFKTKFVEPEHGPYNARCSQVGCSCQCTDGSGGGCEAGNCKCHSEDSDSCESCCCHDDEDNSCNDDCCNETKHSMDSPEEFEPNPNMLSPADFTKMVANDAGVTQPPAPSIFTNIDHLSVVSEETLSNSEVLSHQTENLLGYTPDISGSQTTLPSLVGPLTPLTPIELVANELNDLQAVVPPLSYFENILQQHISSNISSTPGTSSSNSTGKTAIRHTNGWDYNLQSPFTLKRYHANSISPIMQQRSTAQTLTTFVPTTTVTPPPPPLLAAAEIATTNGKGLVAEEPLITSHAVAVIETVPITTMPVNGCVTQSISSSNANTSNSNNSHIATTTNNVNSNMNGNAKPKHFFAPIKPKLKLNTALANQKRLPPPPPPVAASSLQQPSSNANSTTFSNGMQQKCEPPDIYVTNALATPYKHPMKPAVQPPPIPHRITSTATTAQVSSPRQRRKSKQYQSCQQQQQQQHEHHHQQHRHHYQHQLHSLATHVAGTNNDVCAAATKTAATITTTTATCSTPLSLISPTNLKTSLTTALLATNILCMSLNKTLTLTEPAATATASMTSASRTLADTATSAVPPATCLPAALACFKFINYNNICKPNEPLYAIAQNVCHNLIIAPAVNQPLMSSIVKCCSTAPTATATTEKLTTTTTAADSIVEAPTTVSTTSRVVSKTSVPSNGACCADINSTQKPIITTTPATPTTSTAATPTNCSVVDSMCQTDSVNLESILNDIEAISEDILAIQLEKTKSRDNLEKKPENAASKSHQPLQDNNKNSKPYRSEMNLLLTYDGDKSTIKQADPSTTIGYVGSGIEHDSNSSTARRTRSLERDHTDSPSPHIPDPMQPFPDNRKYIGFDHLNKMAASSAVPRVAVTATQTSPILNLPVSQRPHLPLSPLVTNVHISKQNNGKPQPPVPPARSFPSPLNIKCAGIQRSSSVTYKINSNQSPTGSPTLSGVHPNKSQLFSAIANAAARRAQFRSQSTNMTRSLDTDYVDEGVPENGSEGVKDDKDPAENVKRKARRVSIVCADTDSPGSPTEKPITAISSLRLQNSATASCSDLPAVMPNPALRNLKQTSHSTPNSPHSSRKHEGSPLSSPPIVSITPPTPHHGRNLHGNGSQHHHGHSNSYPNAVATTTTIQQQRKNSQDTIKASAAEIASAAANAVRSKCSRRHSDGTVSHTNQRSSGASGGTNGGHHHAHHNHHHHQHSSSLVSTTNPHHSHHSRQDSNHETVASYSDRNSNSLASSRESSASFSMRSTRRKLSVSSHTGGKIPWCGCWGNGCL